MMWEGMNQRRFLRVAHKCRVRVARQGAESMIDAITENIGSGGICVEVDRELELFERVSINITLEGNTSPVNCQGTVMWVVKRHPMTPQGVFKYDIGIEFLSLSPQDKQKISDLLEHISRA
jgi:hypothetical protein